MKIIELIFLVLSVLGIIQGLILIVTLNLQNKQNRLSNVYISLCIFFMMYLLLEFLLVRRTIPTEFHAIGVRLANHLKVCSYSDKP